MDYLQIPLEDYFRMLKPPKGKVKMVLDTDAYNEVDDQFAISYALRSEKRLEVQALYAAPFSNERADDPGEGMEKSYREILTILERLGIERESGFVLRGSESYLEGRDEPVESEAARDLVERALDFEVDDPLYVVAIGAITNVASAILMEPEVVRHMVVIWLGGQPLHWPTVEEFNLYQDPVSAGVIFDSGVPLVLIPCLGVSSHLLTTLAELERDLKGRSEIGTYLTETVEEYSDDHFAWAKEIWDISAIGYLINPEWVPTEIVHSPILTEELTWSVDRSRHPIRVARFVKRNPIFRDMFAKLAD